ncbi:MAG TPA: gluconokinase [Pyrinomonadaceae bacterium]
MRDSFILALDIGTSSVRAALYDFRGRVLPETMVKNERVVEITDDGGAQLDAEEALSQVFEAIDDVLEKNDALIEQIEYVAMSCFWHSLVGVDREGHATTPVYTWAETRPANYVQTLRDELNETGIHNRTGARFHSSFWTAKLLWLREEFPDDFAKTAKWLSFSDLAAERLLRDYATSVSMASGTGIFDIRRNDWDDELLDFLKIRRDQLPRIAEDDETFRIPQTVAPDGSAHSSSPRSKRWEKLRRSAKCFLAIGDGAANNIGAGCVRQEKAALMVGTSGAMRVAFRGDVPEKIPSGLWCYRIDRTRVIAGGALSDGGGLFRWLKDNLKLDEEDDHIEREIAKRRPDAHGLTFLPFLAGERSTGYHETASGAILGLKSATDAIDIVQAALESVAYRFAEIYDQLNDVLKIKEVIASGGALRASPVWTQILCDVLASKMSLPDTREASSRGAVLLALESIGKIEDISNLETPEGTRFDFDSKRHEIYGQARKRHEEFYKLLIK